MKLFDRTIREYISEFEYAVELIGAKTEEAYEHLNNTALRSSVQIAEAVLCLQALKGFILTTEQAFTALSNDFKATCQKEVYTGELVGLVNRAHALLEQRNKLIEKFQATELAMIAELDRRASSDKHDGDKLKSLSMYVKSPML